MSPQRAGQMCRCEDWALKLVGNYDDVKTQKLIKIIEEWERKQQDKCTDEKS